MPFKSTCAIAAAAGVAVSDITTVSTPESSISGVSALKLKSSPDNFSGPNDENERMNEEHKKKKEMLRQAQAKTQKQEKDDLERFQESVLVGADSMEFYVPGGSGSGANEDENIGDKKTGDKRTGDKKTGGGMGGEKKTGGGMGGDGNLRLYGSLHGTLYGFPVHGSDEDRSGSTHSVANVNNEKKDGDTKLESSKTGGFMSRLTGGNLTGGHLTGYRLGSGTRLHGGKFLGRVKNSVSQNYNYLLEQATREDPSPCREKRDRFRTALQNKMCCTEPEAVDQMFEELKICREKEKNANVGRLMEKNW